MAKKEYEEFVVGFVFDHTRSDVLLQQKARPEWMAGKWNGPGGKVNPGEDVHQAIAREVAEETTLLSQPEEWRHFATIVGGGRKVYFLSMFLECRKYDIRSTRDDEPVRFTHAIFEMPRGGYHMSELDVVPNLLWLVPLALDAKVHVPVLIEDDGPG